MNLIPTSRDPSLRRWILARLMRLINANPTGYWYRWKDILLHIYGEEDGFDTQRLEAPCWTCGGMGDCYDCNEGVHHVTRTKLWRWQIEGHVFHRPSDVRIWNDSELAALEKVPGWHRRIIGRVTHRPTPPALSREAEAWLLLLLGQYRSLGRWLQGAGGSSHLAPCWWLPFSAVRAALCNQRVQRPFSFGSGIALADAKAFELMPCKGALGFFKPKLESEVGSE